ncbi:hypothetical protein THAOC_05230 [Thalassiosira oceanica]|uniref:Uncharacterized protein n=1 Tax=Thalassiosira oceanica TaxID=159749 RepID=K0T3D2_THAOC|nr:hypothetical protein THAOC_05230 [Thalassiosira oceanica]|eukprot:EJK73163.1 hypothetical protein THAOC_05230 [Thalassiosira oceanica]
MLLSPAKVVGTAQTLELQIQNIHVEFGSGNRKKVFALTQSVLVTSSGGLRVKGSDKLEVDGERLLKGDTKAPKAPKGTKQRKGPKGPMGPKGPTPSPTPSPIAPAIHAMIIPAAAAGAGIEEPKHLDTLHATIIPAAAAGARKEEQQHELHKEGTNREFGEEFNIFWRSATKATIEKKKQLHSTRDPWVCLPSEFGFADQTTPLPG